MIFFFLNIFMNYSTLKMFFIDNHGLLSGIGIVPYSNSNVNGRGLYHGTVCDCCVIAKTPCQMSIMYYSTRHIHHVLNKLVLRTRKNHGLYLYMNIHGFWNIIHRNNGFCRQFIYIYVTFMNYSNNWSIYLFSLYVLGEATLRFDKKCFMN